MMGDSTSQDLELLMPEKSEEIIIKPETIEKFQTTEERSRLNFYFRGTESKIFSRIQNRSASVFSSEPSNSEMTEMQDFSEETEKRYPRIQIRSASVLSPEPSNSEMTEMQEFSEETEKRFPRIQNRSASVFSSEPSNSEMTEMQDFSEETEKTISQNSDKICFYSFF